MFVCVFSTHQTSKYYITTIIIIIVTTSTLSNDFIILLYFSQHKQNSPEMKNIQYTGHDVSLPVFYVNKMYLINAILKLSSLNRVWLESWIRHINTEAAMGPCYLHIMGLTSMCKLSICWLQRHGNVRRWTSIENEAALTKKRKRTHCSWCKETHMCRHSVCAISFRCWVTNCKGVAWVVAVIPTVHVKSAMHNTTAFPLVMKIHFFNEVYITHICYRLICRACRSPQRINSNIMQWVLTFNLTATSSS